MGLFVKKISPISAAAGLPSVVLLHGFCEDHRVWDNVLQTCADRVVYLVDLPGFGNSMVTLPTPLTIDWVADAIYEEVIAPEKSAPIIIGHSLGGYVALAIAEKYGPSISGLCLFHSTAFADTPEKKETRNKVIDFVTTSGVKTYTSQFVPGLFHSVYRRSNPGNVQEVVDIASATRLDTLTAYAAAMRDRPDRMKVLETFAKAKLVVAGEKDGAVPLEQSLAMKDVVGEANFVLLKDVAHMGMYENPEESRRALSRLL